MPEQRTIRCPFCERGELVALYTPRTLVTHYSHASSNRKAMNYYRDENYSIISEKCPNCGKSRKEIEKVLKEGKRPTRDEIVRRAKEAGLPLRF